MGLKHQSKFSLATGDDRLTDRYGQRTIVKMFNEVNALRKAIRSEGTPKIQEAWDKVEEHIDYVYAKQKDGNDVD